MKIDFYSAGRLKRTKLFHIFRFMIPSLLAIAGLVSEIFTSERVSGKPFLLLYSTLFIGSLIGGLTPGITATLTSCIGVWIYYVAAVFSAKETDINIPVKILSVFVTGTLLNIFGSFLHSLRFEFIQRSVRGKEAESRVQRTDQEWVIKEKELTLLVEAAEGKLRALLESAEDAVIIVDSDGMIELVNEQVSRWFGYSPAELIGLQVELLVPERLRDRHAKHRREYTAHPKRRSMGDPRLDLKGRRKDGSEFSIDISLSWVDAPTGRLITAIIRDLSERDRRENRERFLSGAGNLLSQSVEFNRTLEQVAKLATEDFADGCAIRLIGDDGTLKTTTVVHRDSEKQQKFGDLLKSRELLDTNSTELQNVLQSKRVMFCSESTGDSLPSLATGPSMGTYAVVPMVSNGRLMGILSFISGTANRWTEKEDGAFFHSIGILAGQAIENALLSRESERAKLIINHLPAKIAYWSSEQKCLFANTAYINWFGIAPENVPGRTMKELLGTELYNEKLPYIKGVLNGIEQRFERDLIVSKTGEIRHTNVLYFPEVVDGTLLGFFALVTDVTDLKNIQLNATREKEKALAAAQTREDVVAIVSHDLKNPLASISLATQLIRRLGPDEFSRIHALSERVQHAVGRMQKLIADLLDSAKIEGGTFSVEKFREDPKAVLLSGIDGIRDLIEAKLQHFDVEIAEDLPEVACDFARMDQVLSNLIGNAIKFTPRGGTVRLCAVRGKEGVLVSIHDTGLGIPPEQLPKVFDRFWQSEATRQMGSGLGLSIVKGIIEAHGARIWVESAVGRGSIFSFIIPFATSEMKAARNWIDRNPPKNSPFVNRTL